MESSDTPTTGTIGQRIERLNAIAVIRTIGLCFALVIVAFGTLAYSMREIAVGQARLNGVEKQLEGAAQLAQYISENDWFESHEVALHLNPSRSWSDVIKGDWDQRQFGPGRAKPNYYTSKNYAEHVLRESGIKLSLDMLPRDNGEPRVGDIIEYGEAKGGNNYFLFYIGGGREDGRVVGLTPLGIIALREYFGVNRISIVRTGLGIGRP